MSDSPNLTWGVVRGRWGKPFWDMLPGGRFARGGWKTVDPLYIWSAVIALFVAIGMIAVALVIQTGRVH